MRGASRCLLVAFPGSFPSILPVRALSWAARGRRWASLCPAAAWPEPPFLPGSPHHDVELQREGLRGPLSPWEAATELGCFPSICPGVCSRLQLPEGMRSQGTHGCHQPTNAPYPCPCFGTWREFPRIWAAPPAPGCCWLVAGSWVLSGPFPFWLIRRLCRSLQPLSAIRTSRKGWGGARSPVLPGKAGHWACFRCFCFSDDCFLSAASVLHPFAASAWATQSLLPVSPAPGPAQLRLGAGNCCG